MVGDIRELIAYTVMTTDLSIMDLDSDVTESSALTYMNMWNNLKAESVHEGDCTKVAHTCLVCLKDHYYKQADIILSVSGFEGCEMYAIQDADIEDIEGIQAKIKQLLEWKQNER